MGDTQAHGLELIFTTQGRVGLYLDGRKLTEGSTLPPAEILTVLRAEGIDMSQVVLTTVTGAASLPEDLNPPADEDPVDPNLLSEAEIKRRLIDWLLEDEVYLDNLLEEHDLPSDRCLGGAISAYEFTQFELKSRFDHDLENPIWDEWEHTLTFSVDVTFPKAKIRADNTGPDWSVEGSLWIRGLKDTVSSFDIDEIFYDDSDDD